MLEAFQSLRDELTSKKLFELDQTSASASKPGPSQAAVNLDLPPPRQPRAASNVEQMEVDYGPALPPHLGADHHMTSDQPSSPAEEPSKKASGRPKTHSHSHTKHDVDPRSASDQYNDDSDEPWISSSKSKKHADKSKHKVRSRYVSSSSEEDQSSVVRHRSSKPSGSVIKDAFDKFGHDFQAAKLPEGKYIKPPPSTTKWYKVGQPCYEEKIQELNTHFAKICIIPKPPGAPMGKVPLPILKELEHQARQNISTLNYTAAFAKTSSSCNATLEKCQHSLKSTFKRVKSQIQKGANPEQAAKHGYEQACIRLFLCNIGLSLVSENPWPIYSKGSYIPWVTPAC